MVCPVVTAELKRLPQSSWFWDPHNQAYYYIIIIIIKIGKTSPKIEIVNYKFENEVILKVSNARSERKKLEKIIRFFIFDFSCETRNID
jgi:hypothetical protein